MSVNRLIQSSHNNINRYRLQDTDQTDQMGKQDQTYQ